ncbi:unnamed protein product [Vicia faba]|uniref:Uncharacterized protein n=1 Tax=Vicia faba TaxID=3906 RepID=A0AAV1A2D7_VICFA|nr:unnamed protein product [Vicia faba]
MEIKEKKGRKLFLFVLNRLTIIKFHLTQTRPLPSLSRFFIKPNYRSSINFYLTHKRPAINIFTSSLFRSYNTFTVFFTNKNSTTTSCSNFSILAPIILAFRIATGNPCFAYSVRRATCNGPLAHHAFINNKVWYLRSMVTGLGFHSGISVSSLCNLISSKDSWDTNKSIEGHLHVLIISIGIRVIFLITWNSRGIREVCSSVHLIIKEIPLVLEVRDYGRHLGVFMEP